VEVPETVLIRGFKVKRNINNRDRQDKKDKVKSFGVWRNHSCLVLMVLSYTSCISLFKKSLRPYGYWWSEVDNQIIQKGRDCSFTGYRDL
jgi:hypothetical protein